MYSSGLAIFTAAFLISIQVAFSDGCNSNLISNENTNQYQPLYVTKKNNGYSFVDSDTYNSVMKQQSGQNSDASGDRNELLAACPETPNIDKVLNIMPVGEQQIANGFRCNAPVEFFVRQRSIRRVSEHYLIGFMIYDDSGISSANNSLLSGIPTTIFPISLIKVALRKLIDEYVNITTWHDIKYANMLPVDGQSDDRLQNREHYKNILIYGYDIDPAYQQINQLKFIKAFFKSKKYHHHKLVKLQLAPADDFFFDAWKRASFNNINTTPVWDELIPEWRQFEKFIRRVADIVGELQIITGGFEPYIIFEPGNDDTNIELYRLEHSMAPAVRVFEKIFKAVSFNQKRQNDEWIRQGIVFTMINDPRIDYKSHDTFAYENGWKYDYERDRKIVSKIRAKAMNPDSMKELGVIVSYTYEPFNLNQVKKLAKNDRDEEIVNYVDVLGEMYRKAEFPSDFITGIGI